MRRLVLCLLPALVVMLMATTACTDTPATPTATAPAPPTATLATAASTSTPASPTVAPTATARVVAAPTRASTAVATPTKTAVATRGAARFEPEECPFSVPRGLSVQCGFVVVPEDHGVPAGPTIRLAVAIFKGQGTARPPDPVLLLAGGPGEKVVYLATSLAQLFAPLYGGRDFIVFDQRGAGLSEPALDCPEYVDALYYLLEEPDPIVEAEAAFAALLSCRDRLVDEGYNLSAYNTVQNAADVDALRLALGYEKVNLLGGSYGSLLAQAVMRDYPQGIRSVAISSILPLEKSFFVDLSKTSSKALERLLAACSGDGACNAAYPDLKGVLFQTVDRLNVNPVPITVTHPLDGGRYGALLTGDAVVGNLVALLYQTEIIPLLPKAIYDVDEGNYALMTQLVSLNLMMFDAVSRGMQYSVLCTDDLIGRTEQDYLDNKASLPSQFAGRLSPEVGAKYGPFALCKGWPVKQADPSVKRPLVSNIPTLVLGGEFDPVTPPEYGRLVAGYLPNSFFFEIAGAGHNVMTSSECARQITRDFFDRPTAAPSSACLASQTGVAFDVPGEAAKIELQPFSDAQQGFRGVVPKGWKEIAPGNFLRASSPLDQVFFALGAQPTTAAELLGAMAKQLGLDPKAKPTRQARLGSFTWDFYTFAVQGLPFDIALAEKDGNAYYVFLLSPADEHDGLLQNLFLPAVEAVTPLQ